MATTGRRLLPLAIGALLTLLLLILVGTRATVFAQDEPTVPIGGTAGDAANPSSEEISPAAVDANAKITLTVRTPGSSGPVTTTDVINSDIITYEFTFKNTTGAAISNLVVTVNLQQGGLDTFTCLLCVIETHPEAILNALGEEEIVQVADTLEWNFGNVPNNATTDGIFTARVVGQAGGTLIERTALATYNSGGVVSNKVSLDVVADVPNEPVNQANAVSATPNWFSDDKGGTLDLDWADVDQDGDLDLALASSLGTGVYMNEGGQLIALWRDPDARVVYGVRWLDVNGDGVPELVAVGSPDGDVGGKNYVFQFNPGTFQSPDRFTLMPNGEFETANQLTRIETGHFNNDNLPDLLVSVNAISADCPVFILYNEGANLFNGEPVCVSNAATAAIQAGDVNKDGLADLAIGVFPNQVRVIINETISGTTVLSQTNPLNILVDASNRFLPYDFAFGDVDGDGDLDLAAAFPLQREVRLYRNDQTSSTNVSFSYWLSIPTTVFQTPYAVEFGDLDRDGAIDLVVGDAQPTIYWNTRNNAQPYATALRTVLTLSGERSETWAIRAVDQDGNGSLEISIANRNGPSMLLANYASALRTQFTQIAGSGTGGSVVWGDVNNDAFNDLLIGSADGRNSSRVFLNKNGAFSSQNSQIHDSDTIGSHAVGVGDLNLPGTGGSLEVMILSPSELKIVHNGNSSEIISIPGLAASEKRILVPGDMDGDGDLDVALALTPGGAYILENRAGEGDSSLLLRQITNAPEGIQAMAWGDLNGDHYLDLAIGSTSGLSIYVNNSDGTFTPVGSDKIIGGSGITCLQGTISAVAWGDVNGDGYPDLAIGNTARPGCVLQNNFGGLTAAQQSAIGTLTVVQQFSNDLRNVSSLDWGDWDNDGDLDLAVAHASGPVRVLSNTAGRLLLLWQSQDSFAASGVRWGDKDGDSDLDLALSRASGSGNSGFFENHLVEPAHLLAEAEASLLPNPSAYAYVRRPGVTRSAYDYSTSELLAGPSVATIPVSFRLFKPDGDESDPAQIYNLLYDFSLDSGGTWKRATAAAGQSSVITTTLTREGSDYNFIWDARADQAISEKALFRVSVINPSSGSTVQNAVGMGISPPFQARAITCVWPADPGALINNIEAVDGAVFQADPDSPTRTSLAFGARLAEGTGVMTFNWKLVDEFGREQNKQGQRVSWVLGGGDYTLTMTAQGRACPQTRTASKTYRFSVGINAVYLPMLISGTTTSVLSESATVITSAAATEANGATFFDTATDAANDTGTPLVDAAFFDINAAEVLDPVTELDGSLNSGSVHLTWQLASPWGIEQVRIYRQPLDGSAPPLVEAQLPTVQGNYNTLEGCGFVYSVVALSGGSEIAAQQEYRTPVCGAEVGE